MGSSESTPTPQLPTPSRTLTPKRNNDDDKFSKCMDVTSDILSKIGQLSSMMSYIGWPDLSSYFDGVSFLLEHLKSQKDSIEEMNKCLKQEIKHEVFTSKLTTIRSEFLTIKSRVEEMLNNSDQHVKKSNAVVAIHSCEKVLNEFDIDKNLWNSAMMSSTVLLPFAGICALAIGVNFHQKYSSADLCKRMKTQLQSLLQDYRKQTVLMRLNCIQIEISYFNVWVESDMYEVYRLGDVKFESESKEWTEKSEMRTSFLFMDDWIDCRQSRITYADIIKYRKQIDGVYGKEFDEMIKKVDELLSDVNSSNADWGSCGDREFCKATSYWGAVGRFR